MQTQNYSDEGRLKQSPDNWQSDFATAADQAEQPWYQHYATPKLDILVAQALQNKLLLQQLKLATEIQSKRLTIAQANLWPSLSIGFDARRQQGSEQLRSRNQRPSCRRIIV